MAVHRHRTKYWIAQEIFELPCLGLTVLQEDFNEALVPVQVNYQTSWRTVPDRSWTCPTLVTDWSCSCLSWASGDEDNLIMVRWLSGQASSFRTKFQFFLSKETWLEKHLHPLASSTILERDLTRKGNQLSLQSRRYLRVVSRFYFSFITKKLRTMERIHTYPLQIRIWVQKGLMAFQLLQKNRKLNKETKRWQNKLVSCLLHYYFGEDKEEEVIAIPTANPLCSSVQVLSVLKNSETWSKDRCVVLFLVLSPNFYWSCCSSSISAH